jgi:DNA-binding CsgD family transcriptional regulator
MIASMPRVSSPIFVGRAAELDRLGRALEHAEAGRATTHLIAGEAGIGKTRLVEEFMGRARARGAQVLAGACLQLGETGLPYAPFVAALRPLVRALPPERLDVVVGPGRADLAHLMPDLGPPPAPAPDGPRLDPGLGTTSAQARLFEVVLGVLRRLAEDRPLVLVLEDIHWADSSTRDLLRFIVRNGRDEAVMIVATFRSDELHRRHPLRPLVAELQRLDGVDDIELTAFDAAELAAQLTGITGSEVAPQLVEAVLARSGGNPFFAEELMAAGAAGLVLPRSLRDTLEDRIRRLETDAQQVIRVASVAGARVDHGVLAEVAGLPADRLTEAVRQVVEHHLLVPTAPDEAPGYAFRHALVQEVVYEELLPSERTHLHAAYAQSMAARGERAQGGGAASAAQVAHHWLLAHDLERALHSALAAARSAAAGFAFAEAQAFLERALELWPKVAAEAVPEGVDRIMILEEAAEAAAQAGDARRSIDLVRSALAELEPRSDPMRSGVLQHRLAWYLNESGDWQAGVAAFERAAQLIPIDPPTAERARVLADLAHSLMVRSRFGDSLALAEAALAISRAVGARSAEARALNVIGLDLACRSDFERGVPILREGNDLAVELGDPLAIFLTAVGLGWALDESARHAEALELARATRDRVRHLGADARFGGQLASKAARALIELGRWDEASELIEETIDAGPTRYAVRWLLSNRLRLRAARGELDEAAADFAMYDALGERVIGPDPDLMNVRRAELALAAGDPLAAAAAVRDTISRMAEPELDSDARLLLMLGLRAEAAEAELARAAGDGDRQASAIQRAEALASALEDHVARVTELAQHPSRIIGADRTLAVALVSRTRGLHDAVAWEAAVAERRAIARPYELALVLAESAVTHLALRQREEGAAELAEAHAIATELRAGPLRGRLEGLARRARIGLEGVDTADDTADRLGLTQREREVLALVADGRSNRQIGEQLYMAESTAGVHVSNILGKLGVTRRSEAAAVAHRLGLLGVS